MEPENITTEERDYGWIRQFQGGDPTGFEKLFKTYIHPLCHFLQRHGGLDAHEAEDLGHDIMIRVYESLPRFYFSARFTTWLYTIALNHVKNFKQHSRHAPLFLNDEMGTSSKPHDGAQTHLAHASQEPHEAATRNELRAALQEGLALLPEKERAVFILKEFQDMTFQEISEIMGQTLRNIQFIKDKANLHLQRHLESQGFSNPHREGISHG